MVNGLKIGLSNAFSETQIKKKYLPGTPSMRGVFNPPLILSPSSRLELLGLSLRLSLHLRKQPLWVQPCQSISALSFGMGAYGVTTH